MTGTVKENNNYNRRDLINDLNNYNPTAAESSFIPKFLDLLHNEDCFYRTCFPAHITGSALLLNQTGDQILMNHHKSLNKWLGFGGHADGDEDILAVAIRETMEESGMTAFKPLSSDIIDIDIHAIPENKNKNEPAHYHYDIRYIMQMTGEQNSILSDKSHSLQWMSRDEALSKLEPNDSLNRLIQKSVII